MLTIPTTAATPVEYIPETQDVARYERERGRALADRRQALKRREAALATGTGDDTAEALADAQKVVAEDEARYERALEQMRTQYPEPQRFLLAVPTSVEREQVNSRLTALGLRQITTEQIRATMIEELFHTDWSEDVPLSAAENDAIAEDHANFLDGYWLRQEAAQDAENTWREQEAERIADELAGAPAVPAADQPPRILSVRDKARATLLTDRMMSHSQRLRDLAAMAMDYNRQNAVLLVRMHVVGVSGFEPTVPIARDPKTRVLSEAAVAALREQVDDVSWTMVVQRIDQMYSLSGSEEKNSVSQPERLHDQSGSIEPSAVPASNGGSSTISSSEPLPAGGSETITDRSSGFTSAFATDPVPIPPSDFPTAGV